MTSRGILALLLAFWLRGISSGRAAAAETWKHFAKENGLPGDEIQFLKQDDAGDIWAGTLTGLAVFRAGKFSTVIQGKAVWDILKVGPEKYWIGTDGGALLLDRGKEEPSLAGNTVAPILRYNDGDVWALSKNSHTETNTVMENSGSGWSPVERLKNERVAELFQTRDGSIWVVIEGNGVLVVLPKEGPSAAAHYLEGLNVTTLFQDSKGRVWCGLWGKGIAVWDKGKWTRQLEKETGAVLCIREDAAGGIWAATNEHGLWRFDGKVWVNDATIEGEINTLETTSDGRVWISSQADGGLRYWDGARWQVSLDIPLSIRCLLETRENQLWAGGILDGIYLRVTR